MRKKSFGVALIPILNQEIVHKNMPEGGVVLRPLKATQLMWNSTVG